MIIGSLIAGYLINWWGARKICLVASTFISGSWLLIALGNSFATIFIGRVISGIFYGLCLALGKNQSEDPEFEMRLTIDFQQKCTPQRSVIRI